MGNLGALWIGLLTLAVLWLLYLLCRRRAVGRPLPSRRVMSERGDRRPMLEGERKLSNPWSATVRLIARGTLYSWRVGSGVTPHGYSASAFSDVLHSQSGTARRAERSTLTVPAMLGMLIILQATSPRDCRAAGPIELRIPPQQVKEGTVVFTNPIPEPATGLPFDYTSDDV